ncbi:MAG TPA: phosphoribosyltransferase [Solirubrobacteraceae bacterium]|nr:phosphoribosyltransferase [Solirubrobacteraceae bacterium]
MPTVRELSAPYGNFMLGPRPGPGVCEVCFDLTAGPPRCHHCARPAPQIAAVTPISYSVAHEQLHHALAAYKRAPGRTARAFARELAAVLWRHLDQHEGCLARAAGVGAFTLVTTVPSGARERDAEHPLRRIVGELVAPTRDRYAPALERSDVPVAPRMTAADKYRARQRLDGQTILLIDDTWTTGASARSAAIALDRAGAARVAVLVLGRYLHRDYRDNAARLATLPDPFDWDHCAHHAHACCDVSQAHPSTV